jgi:hypothetical protein
VVYHPLSQGRPAKEIPLPIELEKMPDARLLVLIASGLNRGQVKAVSDLDQALGVIGVELGPDGLDQTPQDGLGLGPGNESEKEDKAKKDFRERTFHGFVLS